MFEDEYKNFCARLKKRLDEEVNGSVFIEAHPTCSAVLVKISFKGNTWTRLIYKVTEGLQTDPSFSDKCLQDTLKYYRRHVFEMFFKNYSKPQPGYINNTAAFMAY